MNPEDLEKAHCQFAPGLFNKTWEYLLKEDRTTDETEEMIHIAHASRYHWSKIGKDVNLARGEWLLARVYSVAGRADEALKWAERCRERCEGSELSTFDQAASCEAVSRALAVGGRKDEAVRWRDRAADYAAKIEEVEEKKIFDEDLASLNALLD
jgi:hypothetical protein